jgi:hypothetical protein
MENASLSASPLAKPVMAAVMTMGVKLLQQMGVRESTQTLIGTVMEYHQVPALDGPGQLPPLVLRGIYTSGIVGTRVQQDHGGLGHLGHVAHHTVEVKASTLPHTWIKLQVAIVMMNGMGNYHVMMPDLGI